MKVLLSSLIGIVVSAVIMLVSFFLGKRTGASSVVTSTQSIGKKEVDDAISSAVSLNDRRAELIAKYQILKGQAQTFANKAEELDSNSVDEISSILESAIRLTRELSQ